MHMIQTGSKLKIGQGLIQLCWQRFDTIQILGVIFILIITETTAKHVSAMKCAPLDNSDYRGCACKMQDTGETYNLKGITDNCTYTPVGCAVPRFQTEDDTEWFYSYNPCNAFSLFQNETHKYPGYKPCKRVAAARWTSLALRECDGLGYVQHAEFITHSKLDPSKHIISNLTLAFRNKETKYGMTINLICNKTKEKYDAIFKYLGKFTAPEITYFFSLESKCCCPDACTVKMVPATTPEVTKQLLWIIFLAVGVLLLVVTVAYFCMRGKQQAGEQKPLLA